MTRNRSKKRPTRKSKPWTDREDALICQAREQGIVLRVIAERLINRTTDAVAKRVQYLIRKGILATRNPVDPDRKRWIPSDDEILCRMRAQGASLRDMAKVLNRTFNAVAIRTHDLIQTGTLERVGPSGSSRRWSAVEDRKLAELRSQGKTAHEIALLLGRSLPSINGRIATRIREGHLKLERRYKPRQTNREK